MRPAAASSSKHERDLKFKRRVVFREFLGLQVQRLLDEEIQERLQADADRPD